MRIAVLALSASMLVTVPALAQTTTSASGAATDQVAQGASDQAFGKLAGRKASSSTVRHFADKMVADHTEANQKLMQTAREDNITVPHGMDDDHKAMRADLEKKDGTDFDKAYIQGQLADHEKTIALFETEAQSGTDPKLKQLAADTLPMLKMHLEMVKSIESKMASN
jgi:putative membrane protein